MFVKTVILSCVTLAIALGSTQISHADDREQARAAFMQGRAAFKAGRFEEAAKHLSEAYKLKPHPALLRYLGQSYLKLGKAPQAIDHFERYLKEAPQAPDRAKVRARIAELKKALAEAEAKAQARRKAAAAAAAGGGKAAPVGKKGDKPLKVNLAPTGEDEEMPDVIGKPITTPGERVEDDEPAPGSAGGGRWMTYGKWTSAVLGVGGLAAGLVFNLMASSKASELEDAAKSSNPDLDQPTVAYNADHFSLQQDYKRFNTLALVSYIVGGVFSAAAVTLFVLDRGQGETEQRTALLPWIGKEGGGVAASVVF